MELVQRPSEGDRPREDEGRTKPVDRRGLPPRPPLVQPPAQAPPAGAPASEALPDAPRTVGPAAEAPSPAQPEVARPAPVEREPPRERSSLEHSLTPGEDHEQPEADAPDAPELDAEFEHRDVLGAGGTGIVSLALERATGRQVAIKRLRDPSPRLVRRLEREAEAIRSLDHPGVVRLLRVLSRGEQVALVLEYVPGPDLGSVVRREGPLELARALRIVSAVADALACAHRAGIVHRDVKPSNVLLGPDGAPRVVDFGLALPLASAHSLSRADGPCGTLDYMAPEQWQDADAVDPRADVYSLGATLYHLLTGTSPRVIREQRIPLEVREVVLRCVEERPEDRFPSMDALGDALRRVFLRARRVEGGGIESRLERIAHSLRRELDQENRQDLSRRLAVAASGLVALELLPPDTPQRLSARLQLGEPAEEEVARLVAQVIARARSQDGPGSSLLADAYAVFSVALAGHALGPEGQAAMVRLSRASRQPSRPDRSGRLARAVGELAERGALAPEDVEAVARLAGEGEPAGTILERVLAGLRARAHPGSCPPAEQAVHQARWARALADLERALSDPVLVLRVEKERLASALEQLAQRDPPGDEPPAAS